MLNPNPHAQRICIFIPSQTNNSPERHLEYPLSIKSYTRRPFISLVELTLVYSTLRRL
jgi:hypothetical protein